MKRKSLSKFLSIALGVGIVISSNISASAQTIQATSTVDTQQMIQNTYGSFKYTNGYAAIAKGPVLTKGASGEINISISVSGTTSEKDLKDFIKNNKALFTTEQYSKIVALPAYTKEGHGAELLTQLVSIVFDVEAYNNVNEKNVSVLNSQQNRLLSGLHNLKASDCILKGTRTAVGNSYIPTQAYCFLQLSKLNFGDGKTLKVVNTSSLIGDSNGRTNYVYGSVNDSNLQLVQK